MAPEPIAGRYRLLEPLGRGAMSAVWLADDEELARRVAVKLLAPRADRARFEREARAAAALSDPHICSLYDYGEEDGKPFMVLEYLPNGSLEDRLASGEPLPDEDTRRIATEIAGGLAHAHARGLVHRDLKPANVLFDAEGRAKIADFGIARLGDSRTLTEAGTVLGTASTISPEQAAGLPAGPASDVYSFGVILFRMLTGRLPFMAPNAMEVVRMHRDEPPPAVSDFRRGAPPKLASLAEAALAKDPAARPADGAALLGALGGAGAVAAAGAAAPPLEEATQIMAREPAIPRRRLAALPLVRLVVGILVLLGAGIAAAVVVSGSGGDAPVASTTAPGLSVPTVPAAASTTAPSEPVSTGPATTAHTAPATSSTRAASTSQSTTAPVTTAPTTTARTATAATVPATVPTTATATTALPPPATTAPTSAPTTTASITTTAAPTTTAATTAP